MPASAPAKVEENGAVDCFQFSLTDFFRNFFTKKVYLKSSCNSIKIVLASNVLLRLKNN